MAFGGVPKGDRKAIERLITTGARMYNGATGLGFWGPTQARAGIRIFAAATFETKFVITQAKIEQAIISWCVEDGPCLLMADAIHPDNPDSSIPTLRAKPPPKRNMMSQLSD
eukprot:CAMPEP_0175029032 /NCGR_PEP_ID=MMETSP0005-20121125/19353_1 /TAXON_ID=420556 /ORGANISM="Ochromonas sp., Strain CCMP1393" /LENGTH=111 /DNA_ID=CAMNT_0016288763 /DNA_START=890 /DNA_END=1225 /DNA_ORIENTATION=-